HRFHRRSQRQDRRTPVAHPRSPRRQHRLRQGTTPPPPGLRHQGQSRPPPRQRRLDRSRQLPRIPARHRQAFFRQHDGRQGKRPRPHGRPRSRHQLHRIQLHAPPGIRFLSPPQGIQLRTPDRWQRSMGQHHRRHRPLPKKTRRNRLRPHPPPHHQRRRLQIRQNRRRRHLARSQKNQRLPLLPILDPHRRSRRHPLPQILHLPRARPH